MVSHEIMETVKLFSADPTFQRFVESAQVVLKDQPKTWAFDALLSTYFDFFNDAHGTADVKRASHLFSVFEYLFDIQSERNLAAYSIRKLAAGFGEADQRIAKIRKTFSSYIRRIPGENQAKIIMELSVALLGLSGDKYAGADISSSPYFFYLTDVLREKIESGSLRGSL